VEYRIAQVNIGRIRAELDDPVMAGFVSRLDEVNALAETSPGFVWRLKTDAGNATYLRPYQDQRTLLNMSVWETVQQLRHFVYQTMHAELLRHRQTWFERFEGVYAALWWVPVGYLPGIDKAKRRLAHLETHGPTQFAFPFQHVHPPSEQFQQGIDWSSFVRCTSLNASHESC
jgi:Domain of unknown function (DUF3291)